MIDITQTQTEYQARGRIDKYEQRETKTGKTYVEMHIEGQQYSIWRTSLTDDINPGDMIEYTWKKNGDFRNITELEKINEQESRLGETNQSKSNYKSSDIPSYKENAQKYSAMGRMSALRAATELVAGDETFTADEKKVLVMEYAQEFTNFVLGKPSKSKSKKKE